MKRFISHQGRQMLRDHVFGFVDPHNSLKIHTLSKYTGLHGINNVIQTSGMNNIGPRLRGRHFNRWSNERTLSPSF